MKSILDKSFIYTRSEHTDLRKTFERLRATKERKRDRRIADMPANELRTVFGILADRRKGERRAS